MNSQVKFRLGSDPECLLLDSNGKHISVIGYINADKWHPMPVPGMAEGFTLQEDNVALEYGIPPASSAQELINSIESVMARSLEWLPNLSFSKLSCTVFEKDQMLEPAAHVFGCEPDFNAWTEEANPSPQPPHPFMRSAGGHIHVETQEDPIKVVRAMDLFLGVPSILMDTGEERKQLYGKAGAHRKKSYGVEYRTLSNFWIFEKKYMEWVWNATARALANLSIADTYKDHIIECVNNNNKALASSLCDELHLDLV